MMVDLGSAYRGRRCNTIKILLDHGAMDEAGLARELDIDQRTMHKILAEMEKEGSIACMGPRQSATVFLTNRGQWSGIDPRRSE